MCNNFRFSSLTVVDSKNFGRPETKANAITNVTMTFEYHEPLISSLRRIGLLTVIQWIVLRPKLDLSELESGPVHAV